jgi:elongation factor 2 kinase
MDEDAEEIFERQISELYASALGRLGAERAAAVARRALSAAAAASPFPAPSPLPTPDDAAPSTAAEANSEAVGGPGEEAAADAKSLAAAAAARAISLPAPATEDADLEEEEEEEADADAADAEATAGPKPLRRSSSAALLKKAATAAAAALGVAASAPRPIPTAAAAKAGGGGVRVAPTTTAALAPPPPQPPGSSASSTAGTSVSSLWQRAVSLASRPRPESDDPWATRGVHRRPLERGRRYRYRSETGRWVADDVLVRMDPDPFAAGAMRECWALKKASTFGGAGGGACALGGRRAGGAGGGGGVLGGGGGGGSSRVWPNFVAKRYKDPRVPDAVYVADVVMQMDAKALGEAYNRAFEAPLTAPPVSLLRGGGAAEGDNKQQQQQQQKQPNNPLEFRPPRHHRPPRSVDVLQVSLLRLPDRPHAPLFAIEDAIEGDYVKYNSNSGAVLFGSAGQVGDGLGGGGGGGDGVDATSTASTATATASLPPSAAATATRGAGGGMASASASASRLRMASSSSLGAGGGGAAAVAAAARLREQQQQQHQKQTRREERRRDVLRNTPQAFSHFTYVYTQGRRIVTDVQGVADLYTDPQVHSLDGRGYGDGNLGLRGVALFFRSHQCNPLCARLGLPAFRRCPTDVRAQGYRVAGMGGGGAVAATPLGAGAAGAVAAATATTPATPADEASQLLLPPVAELGATMTRSFLERGRSAIVARLASARARDRATPRLLAAFAVAEEEGGGEGDSGDPQSPQAAPSMPSPASPPKQQQQQQQQQLPPLTAVPLLPAPADAHTHWELSRYYAEVVVLPEARPREDPAQALVAGLFHLEQAAELGSAVAQALLSRAHAGLEPAATSLAVLVASAAGSGLGFSKPSPELAWRYALLAGGRGVPSAAVAVGAALEAAAVAAEEEDEEGDDNAAACAAAASSAPPTFQSVLSPADQLPFSLLLARGGDYADVVFFFEKEEEEEEEKEKGESNGDGANGSSPSPPKRPRRSHRQRLLAAADAWFARAEAARLAVGRAEAYRRRLKEDDESARAAALASGAGGPEDQPLDEAAALAVAGEGGGGGKSRAEPSSLPSASSLPGALRGCGGAPLVPPAWEREARDEAAALLGVEGGDDDGDALFLFSNRPLPCDPLFAAQAEEEAAALLSVGSVAAVGSLLEARARVALLRGDPQRASELLYEAAAAAEESGMGKRAAKLYERAGEAEGLVVVDGGEEEDGRAGGEAAM